MDYNLAKKLKDAGFPQPPVMGKAISGYSVADDIYKHDRQISWYECYCPTLSELIEACGREFDNIMLLDDDLFVANGDDLGSSAYTGSTPEEAVANLWLALNKK